ncbi:MAG: GspE/PulE family protein, partial [Blastocatellia bacterium]
HKPQGLILLLAPTGEGKSVTREAMLRTLERRDSLKIIEFGNPIEFPSNLRTQIELDNDRVTWADASLAALRSNPNVITPSEFRDETEAEWVIKAASTGHLVITTFHATNIAAAFNRLMHLNIRPHDLAEHLTAMISQRLVRVLCPYCSVADGAAQELGYAKALTSPADLEPGRNRLPATWQHLDPRQSGGSVLSNWEAVRNDDGQVLCPHCGDEGYRGRTAILEVMYVTPSVQELILEMDHRSGWSSGRPSSVTGTQIFDRALSEARSQGIHLITLAEAAAKKVEQGITSLSEINRVLGCSPLAFLENPERSESETPDSQLESYETGKGAPYVKTTAVSN